MPPVRSLQVNKDSITFTDQKGVEQILLASDIPPSNDTVTKADVYINAWIASKVTDYQMLAHVISINPLNVAIYTADNDVTIPTNWWIKP